MRAPLCEPGPPKLEKIIAFRRSQDGGVEYLVKKRGCRYSESLWMKEEDLEAQNSAGLLDAYDRIEGKVSEPPFYNPNYDVLDSVVGMVGDRFLVKWKDLGYEELSVEEKLGETEMNDYFARKEARFRNAGDSEFHFRGAHYDGYELNGVALSGVEMVLLNLLLDAWGRQSDVRVKDDWRMNFANAFGAFFHALYSSGNPGPFAIVCGEEDVEEWYAKMKTVMPLTAIVYNGGRESRQELRKLMFRDVWAFHVIVTTPEFLEKDRFLEGLVASVCVLHNVEPEVKFKHGLKVYLVTDQTADSVAPLMELTSMLIGREGRSILTPDVVQRAALVKMKLHSEFGKHVVDQDQGAVVKVREHWIDCPLTRVQRLLIRKIAVEADLDEGFLPLCHKMYRIVSHPFLLYGIERKLNGLNYIAVSTKLQVFLVLMKQLADDGCRVIVVSDFGRMLDLIEDIAISKGYSFTRVGRTDPSQLESSPIILYDPSYCAITQELEFIYTAVVLNGQAKHFREMVRGPEPVLQVSDIFTLTCYECDEDVISDLCSTSSQCEDIRCETACKICTLASCIDKEVPSAEILFNHKCSDSRRRKEWCRSVNDIDEFWRILRESPPPRFPDDQVAIEKGMVWTARERDELIRALFSIGWNRWENLYEATGIMHTMDEIITASRAILRTMIKMTSQSVAFARDFIRGDSTIYDDEESDRKFMERGHFANTEFRQKLKEETPTLLRRMELLGYLANAVKEAGERPELIKLARALGTSPSEWWTEENDRMLVLGTYRYGYGRYDHFCEDSELAIRRVALGSEQRKLDERIIRLAEVIKRSVSFQLEGMARGDLGDLIISDGEDFDEDDLPNQQLTRHDRRKLYQYVCRMGLDSYENIRMNTNVRCSVEDVKSYVDTLIAKANDPSSNLPANTAARIRSRVANMKALREVMSLLSDEDWEYVPRWRQMPDYWTPQIERTFFKQVLDKGMGVYEEIIALPVFAEVVQRGLPPFVTKDASIIKRIQTLHDYAKKPRPDRKKTLKIPNPFKAARSKPKPQKAEEPYLPVKPAKHDEKYQNETPPPSKSPPVKQAKPAMTVPRSDTPANEEHSTGMLEGKVLTLDELATGPVEYPVNVTSASQILSIGHIVTDRPGFHSKRYIYPAGYKSCRFFSSPYSQDKRIVWCSEIIDDGGPVPLFRVSCNDEGREAKFEGRTPTAPWALALKDIATRFKGKGKSISGPEAYLLASKTATFLIQQLPGADMCASYEKKDFKAWPPAAQRPQARRSKKPTQDTTSSESETTSYSSE